MGRPVRMFARGEVYFVTQRCFQGRPLMSPTPVVVRLIGGILARVTHIYDGVHLHDAVFMSNHFHLIISATRPEKIPRFMSWLSREISVRVGALVGWENAFFERRYDASAILDDDALMGRIEYIRQHGVKEGLVPPTQRWPGLTLTPELEEGICRTFNFESKTQKVIEALPILVTPLPGWHDVSSEQSRAQHREIGQRARAQAHTEREGKSYLGIKRVLAVDPSRRPESRKLSNRIPCFASSNEARLEYVRRYWDFVDGLRQAYGNILKAWREFGGMDYCLPGFGMIACSA